MLDVQGIYFFTLCCVRLRYFRSLLGHLLRFLIVGVGAEKNFYKAHIGQQNSFTHLFVINPLQVSDHKFGVGNNKYMEKSTIHVFQNMKWNGP